MASLKELKEDSNWYFDREQQLINFKLRCVEDQVFTYGGGLFNADHTLISIIGSARNVGISHIILLDTLDQPIRIDDINIFEKLVWETNQKALMEYSKNIENLNSIRN